MDEKKKKLRRMATWTIALFGAILAVAFGVLWLVNQDAGSKTAVLGQVLKSGWLVLLVDLVLCGGVYVVYNLVVNRKK